MGDIDYEKKVFFHLFYIPDLNPETVVCGGESGVLYGL